MRLLKIVGWVLLAVIGFGVSLAIAARVLSDRKLDRVVTVPVTPPDIVDSDATRARGKYLYDSRGCMECHGSDGAGRVVLDDPSGFFVRSPNITGFAGAPAANYTNSDWVRTIRHGIKPNGHPVLIMPCEDYSQMTDDDTAALIAYVTRLPAVAGGPAELRLPLLVRGLYVAGILKDADEKIDHSLPPLSAASAASERGAYVANQCRGCHGAGLSGGKIPGAPPAWPPAANLTAAGDSPLYRYTTAQEFRAMMRTGKRPDGGAVSEVMPFASLKNLDDADLDSVFAFLKSLPARPTGNH